MKSVELPMQTQQYSGKWFGGCSEGKTIKQITNTSLRAVANT